MSRPVQVSHQDPRDQTIAALRADLQKLEEERGDLIRWKEDAILVESKWDAREVARELGIRIDQDIRENIMPKILALKADLKRAHEREESLFRSAATLGEQRDTAESDLAACREELDRERLVIAALKYINLLVAKQNELRAELAELRTRVINGQAVDTDRS